MKIAISLMDDIEEYFAQTFSSSSNMVKHAHRLNTHLFSYNLANHQVNTKQFNGIG
jgi:hypothetical protein